MRTLLSRFTVAAAFSAPLVWGCGAMSEEEQLLPDAEISAPLLEQHSAAEMATTPDAPMPAHVRLAWGYLAGNRSYSDWINWTGGLSVTGGSVELEQLVYFEGHDHPVPTTNGSEVDWVSRTGPQYDGMVVKVTPSAADASVHFGTGPESLDVSAADLAAGVNQHLVVDGEGHELAITSVPANACGGFAFGYERQAPKGWLAFGGRLSNPSGTLQGLLRFRVDGTSVQARLLKPDHTPVAQGTGTFATSPDGGSFSFILKKADGTELATVNGLFTAPTYGPRGSFQAQVECAQ